MFPAVTGLEIWQNREVFHMFLVRSRDIPRKRSNPVHLCHRYPASTAALWVTLCPERDRTGQAGDCISRLGEWAQPPSRHRAGAMGWSRARTGCLRTAPRRSAVTGSECAGPGGGRTWKPRAVALDASNKPAGAANYSDVPAAVVPQARFFGWALGIARSSALVRHSQPFCSSVFEACDMVADWARRPTLHQDSPVPGGTSRQWCQAMVRTNPSLSTGSLVHLAPGLHCPWRYTEALAGSEALAWFAKIRAPVVAPLYTSS